MMYWATWVQVIARIPPRNEHRSTPPSPPTHRQPARQHTNPATATRDRGKKRGEEREKREERKKSGERGGGGGGGGRRREGGGGGGGGGWGGRGGVRGRGGWWVE